MLIADSDVLIDGLRGRDPSRGRIAREIRAGSLATTSVNVFELLSGARSRNEAEKVERLLGALTILPFDERTGRHAASLRRTLESAGTPIGTADYLIAAICIANSVALLTRNRNHFERVPDLILADLER